MDKKISKISKIAVALTPFLFAFVFLAFSVRAEPYGWSPNVDHSASVCTDPKPDKAPILMQPNHPALPRGGANEIRLFWHKVPGANGYHVYYGLSPGNYIYSAADIVDTDNFTVAGLSRRKYYFAVQAKKGCAASDLSNEWWGIPGGGTLNGGNSFTASGFTPVNNTSFVEEEPATVPAPAVEGIEQYQEPIFQPTQPPVGNPNPFVPTPTPKPLSFWQKLLRAIFK